MAQTVNLFSKTLGLNNKIAPMRIDFSQQHGLGFLSKAINVDIDESGGIATRKGYVATPIETGGHSLWADGDFCFFVSGSTLYRLLPSYLTDVVHDGLTGSAHMNFARFGKRVFYTNGFQKGAYSDTGPEDWDVINTESRDGARLFSSPPVGTRLMTFAGRIWIAKDEILFFSEPFDPYSYNLAENFLSFSNKITDIVAVNSGFYVMTLDGVDFVSGKKPSEMERINAFNGVPIPGTMVSVNASDHVSSKTSLEGSDKQDTGKKAVWFSQEGIICGDETGEVSNLTRTSIALPKISQAYSGVMYNDGKYIVSTEVI